MNRILPLLLLLFLTENVEAQSLKGWSFTRYTTADGLSDNILTGVAEDSTGFLWLTTRAGLNRFNGHQFIQYHSTDDVASLSSEELAGIYRLDDHRLAIVGSGVHIVDTRTGQRKNIYIPYKDERYVFKFNMTLHAISGKNGDLFVLSRSGFYHFNARDSLVYRFDYYPDSMVAITHLVFGGKMLELDEHHLLITSVNGLYVYDKQRRKLEKISPGDFPRLDEFLSYPKIPFEYFQVKPGVFFIYDPEKKRLCYVDLRRKRNDRLYAAWPAGMNEPGWRSRFVATDTRNFILTLQLGGLVRIWAD
ncbi:MAG: hypothetical protein EOO00_14770, partial [Chitinophagaceae bacterium]